MSFAQTVKRYGESTGKIRGKYGENPRFSLYGLRERWHVLANGKMLGGDTRLKGGGKAWPKGEGQEGSNDGPFIWTVARLFGRVTRLGWLWVGSPLLPKSRCAGQFPVRLR